MRQGVVLFLENAAGEIAFQQRDDMPMWGLFGGWMEAGETPLQTAMRELAEELTVSLPVDRFVFKGAFDIPAIRATAHLYHVAVTHELDHAVLNEGLDWRFMPLAEAYQLNMLPHHVEMLKRFYPSALI